MLIAQSDVREVRRLFQAYDDTEFASLVNEIQEFYLEELIGAELYEDLVDNPTETKYVTLLVGEYYTYSGTKYHFKGVKRYLSYLFFYKYSMEGQVKYTESGRQNFEVDHSQRSPKGIDAQVANDFLAKSQTIGKEILDYLERNSTTYSLYKSEDTSNVPNKDFNFKVVGKTFIPFKSND